MVSKKQRQNLNTALNTSLYFRFGFFKIVRKVNTALNKKTQQ